MFPQYVGFKAFSYFVSHCNAYVFSILLKSDRRYYKLLKTIIVRIPGRDIELFS